MVAGLRVLRPFFGGIGQVVETLGALDGESPYSEWSDEDIRRRINRVLWERIDSSVRRLPTDKAIWQEALPPLTVVIIREDDKVSGPVDWARSVTLYGWPPSRFVVRHRNRLRNTLPLSLLSWVGSRVRAIAKDAVYLAPGILGKGQRAFDLLSEFALGAGESAPSQSDIEAVRREGGLWSFLADIALKLFEAENMSDELLASLLDPREDDEVRGRVFQLAVLGLITDWFYSRGSVMSLGPIGRGGQAVFRVETDGRKWDLCFEVGYPKAPHNANSMYRAARSGMPGTATSLRVDILLESTDGKESLIIECKYSRNLNYVASGFTQVLGYLAEARHANMSMDGLVIGPPGSVTSLNWVQTEGHRLAICDISCLSEALSQFVAGNNASLPKSKLAQRRRS
ncbi:MAG: hypothetical protein EOO38_02550 [Cytophagaceae bacterium]|nr:MAG: hypothetical protein EOO38_02550 [Cytophagaceae bacterium]